jgi:glycosyltransferase involved in cell wall biosynthesis
VIGSATDASTPLVSVITPVLNSARTLEDTLASVAAQTYRNIEHIVVDGGSTDGTIDVLQQFRSSIPLRWISEPDSGMYAAVNKGLRLAAGDVVSYLNGDDLYFPWSVERAVSALLSSGADLVFGDVIMLVKQGGLSRSATIQFYPRFRARVYAHEVTMGQPSVFWRRRVSETVAGFDEQMRYGGDFEYWLRTGAAGFRYTHVAEVLAVAVEHDENLAKVHADELHQEIEVARARYADKIRPRRFARLHALTGLMHWRVQVLLLGLNLRRRHPSRWPDLIQFLKRADVTLEWGSFVPLLLPKPLPSSWSMWRLDPADLERKLTAELWSRCSI